MIGIKVWVFKGELLGKDDSTLSSVTSGAGIDAEKKRVGRKARSSVINKTIDNKLNASEDAKPNLTINASQSTATESNEKSEPVGGEDAATS